MSDQDTQRWGDTQTLTFGQVLGEGGTMSSKQLLNAVWQRPCVWRLMLTIQPNIQGGVTTFNVDFFVQIGVGQANQRLPLASFAFASPYAAVTQFFDIPAETMQVIAQVSQLSATPNPNSNVQVTAMCAPHAEPGAVVQLRDVMGARRDGIDAPDREGLPRWMLPGFDDGELRYRR